MEKPGGDEHNPHPGAASRRCGGAAAWGAWREYLRTNLARKVRVVPSCGDAMRFLRFSMVITYSTLGLACTLSPVEHGDDPFVGNWATAENASITIRPDTIVQHQPDGESTTLDKAACHGMFRFAHGTMSRQDLTSLVPRQPDLRQKISDILVEQSYPVAELNCDRGDQTYVLLSDRQLLAIYRDGDVGAIERLARR
ncbi:MAG TPA: hypothetical protein VH230_17240 [Stellaceae bacterium]|jgi:hypothetical protein|nr:hypothetical protein [Stellaceae bacterium]